MRTGTRPPATLVLATKAGAGTAVTVGAVVSSVMLAAAGSDHAPAPLRNCASTVFTPSPAGSVRFAVVANGSGADQVVPPSVENRMSSTGSLGVVGLVALKVSV